LLTSLAFSAIDPRDRLKFLSFATLVGHDSTLLDLTAVFSHSLPTCFGL
jgi:hypothetical protein